MFKSHGKLFGSVANSAIIFSLACLLTTSAASQAVEADAAKPGFKRCWDVPAQIISGHGVPADDSQAYFIEQTGKVVAVDLASGSIAWRSETGGVLLSEMVVTDGRVIAVASPAGASLSKPVLRAFSSKTGLPFWNIELPASEKYHLAVHDTNLAVISKEGSLWLLDSATGQIIWNASANGSISSPPRIEASRLLVAIDHGLVEEFSIEDGAKIATAVVKEAPAFVGVGKSSAAVYSDDRGNVHSIRMSGGKNWKFRAGGKIVYIRAVSDNVLLGSADNFVYFMSVEYGSLLWKRRLPGRIANGGLVGSDLAVFTVVGDRSAYIVELAKGRVVDKLDLIGDDLFLLTPIRANGKYLVAATANGLSAFSTDCGK